MSDAKVRIVQATQSPLNAKRWLVELACGHECWVTRVRKPRGAVACKWRCSGTPPAADGKETR